MKVRAWSHSALADFINCPKAFHYKRILKKVVDGPSKEKDWGLYVHAEFEKRQSDPRYKLPDNLGMHEEFMLKLDAKPGLHMFTETKVALDTRLKACAYFGPEVFWRGIIDWGKIHGELATVVDYKTGKMKFVTDRQLKEFAIHTFAMYPEVQIVNSQYYWTQTMEVTKKAYGRKEIPDMWRSIAPDLAQYAEAFESDVWQPRQSGLCHGWCPVTDCEFWKPKRTRT